MRCFFATSFATAALVIPFAHGLQSPKDRLESEILPSFQSILNIDKNGVCAAEPGPAVCSAQAPSIATKMTEVNSYTSFDTYVDTLADASLFFQECWNCFVSDLKSNTPQMEQLCGALEDASYALKNVYYQTTRFPTSPLCTELLTKYGDHKSEFTAEKRVQNDVSISQESYPFNKCKNFEGKIKIKIGDIGELSTRSLCSPQASENLGNAVEIGKSALEVLLDGAEGLPFLGFAVSVFNAMFGYICTDNEDTGAELDAAKVYNLATEAAKRSIILFIKTDLTNAYKDMETMINLDNSISTMTALSYAANYMNLANLAGAYGIVGYKLAVGALSHSLSLLSLAKDSAQSAGQSECVEEIEAFFNGRKSIIQSIEDNAQNDFKELRKELKSKNIYHRKIKNWVCTFEDFFFPYLSLEVETYSNDRVGKPIESTRARFGRAPDYCLPDYLIIEKASNISRFLVDQYLDEKYTDLFLPEYKTLFENIKESSLPTPAAPVYRPPNDPPTYLRPEFPF